MTNWADHGGPIPLQYCSGCQSTKSAATAKIRSNLYDASARGCSTPRNSNSSSSDGITNSSESVPNRASVGGCGVQLPTPLSQAAAPSSIALPRNAKTVLPCVLRSGQVSHDRSRCGMRFRLFHPRSDRRLAGSVGPRRLGRFVRLCRTRRRLDQAPYHCRCR